MVFGQRKNKIPLLLQPDQNIQNKINCITSQLNAAIFRIEREHNIGTQRKTNDNYMEYFKIAIRNVDFIRYMGFPFLVFIRHALEFFYRKRNTNASSQRQTRTRLRKKTRLRQRQQWRRRLDIIMCLLLFIITVLLFYRRHYFVVQMCIVAQNVSSVACALTFCVCLHVAMGYKISNFKWI